MSTNRAMRRQLLKEEKHKLISGMSQTIQTAKAQATKEAAESALVMAKNIASHTITDVVIPAIQATLKNRFEFDENKINEFMTAFTDETDKLMSTEENKEGPGT